MRSVLCVRSLQCVASAMWTPIGRATSTRLIPVFSARSTRPAPDGFHHQARLHGFASTSLICLHGFHPKLLSGAPLLLSRLADSGEHRVALATGVWRDSARLKMASAGL